MHVIHVVYGDDSGERDPDIERERVADALGGPDLQWTYQQMRGDPAEVLLEAADEHWASMLVVGRPQHGVEAALGHIVTGSVARNLLRRTHRPVVVVPEFGAVPR